MLERHYGARMLVAMGSHFMSFGDMNRMGPMYFYPRANRNTGLPCSFSHWPLKNFRDGYSEEVKSWF